VLNIADIEEWAEEQGMRTVMSNLHVTVCHSADPVVWSECGKGKEEVSVKNADKREIVEFDGGAIVLTIQNDHLNSRWQDFLDHGAAWKFDDYNSHVTITYNGSKLDIESIEPYRGKILLGPEIFAEPSTGKHKTKEKKLRTNAILEGASSGPNAIGVKEAHRVFGDWTAAKFESRARNWTFYGDKTGYLATRMQGSGMFKVMAAVGKPEMVLRGFETASQQLPLWGYVTPETADLARCSGMVVPELLGPTLLDETLSMLPEAIYGGEGTFIANPAFYTALARQEGASEQICMLGGKRPGYLSEGRIEWAEGVKVTVNPRKAEVLAMMDRGDDLRGVSDGENTYVWQASADIHLNVMKALGISYDHYPTRFHIFLPVSHEPHIAGTDWRGGSLINFEGYALTASGQGLERMMKTTSFLRMIRGREEVEESQKTLVENTDPTKFWLVTRLPTSDREHEQSMRALQDIANMELHGVKGISDSRQIMLNFFHTSGNCCLVMDPKAVFAANKIEKVAYDDPNYLCADNLRAIYRIWAKDPETKLGRTGMINNIVGYMTPTMKSINPNVAHAIEYNNLGWKAGDEFDRLGFRPNSPQEFSQALYQSLLAAAKEWNNWSTQDFETELRVEDIQVALVDALARLSKVFNDESEWLVNSPSLKIPRGSSLLLLRDKDVEAHYGAWKDGTLNSMLVSRYRYSFEAMAIVDRLIEENDLHSKYRIKFVDGMTFAKSSARAKSKKREKEQSFT
jgi:hypothetical protein